MYENLRTLNMADRAFIAILANQLYSSQPEEIFNRYVELLTKQTRVGLTFDEGTELINISPLTLLAKVLGVRRSYLDDKIHGVQMIPQYDAAIDMAIGKALAEGTLERYGVDIHETYRLAETLNTISRGRYSPNDFIENDLLRNEIFLAVAQARVDLDFLDSDYRMYDPFQEKEINQPIYSVFADLTNSQEQVIAEAIKEHNPFGLDDFFDSYVDDFESGAYFLPYEENQDISIMWQWFREFYETR